jgi:hypothetical protein
VAAWCVTLVCLGGNSKSSSSKGGAKGKPATDTKKHDVEPTGDKHEKSNGETRKNGKPELVHRDTPHPASQRAGGDTESPYKTRAKAKAEL